MFDADAQRGNPAISLFVQVRELPTFGLLLRLQNGHIVEFEALKAGILGECAAVRKSVVALVSQFLVMPFALDRLRQEQDLAGGVDQDVVLDRMLFFLPL